MKVVEETQILRFAQNDRHKSLKQKDTRDVQKGMRDALDGLKALSGGQIYKDDA
ncbi:MAG: hypothetical protein KY468_11005 [Armatimonadetes bacterium]|nr:hypothetical protein [Armatimonadota bacterium]